MAISGIQEASWPRTYLSICAIQSPLSSLQWPSWHPSHSWLLCGPFLILEIGGLSTTTPFHFLIQYVTLSAYDLSRTGRPTLLHTLQRWLYTLALYLSPGYMRIVMAILLLGHPLDLHLGLSHINRPMMLESQLLLQPLSLSTLWKSKIRLSSSSKLATSPWSDG